MIITIKEELLPALEREATIAGRTSEEYVEMIMNYHLAEKKKFRIIEDIDFIGIDAIKESVATLKTSKEATIAEEKRLAEEAKAEEERLAEEEKEKEEKE